MKYLETKERSVELLRTVLAAIGPHDAALNPLAFAVFYEHAAGINSPLSDDLARTLAARPRLGDLDLLRLYREHVVDVDDQAVRRASGALERVMSGMAETAARTGERAGHLGRSLQASGPGLEGIASLQAIARTLQQEVESARAEIERLRADLDRARGEALLDPLTRTANRKAFDEKLALMLSQPQAPGAAHCLVMMDLDRFKSINDTYGHVMGDRVLQAVAEALRLAVSEASCTLARIGGEEFALLLPQSTLEDAVAVAQRCCDRVRSMNVRDRRSGNVMLKVTISAGVAAWRADEDGMGLLANADAALYAAKQAGRDRVRQA